MNINLLVGTPMYGGACTMDYTQSLLNLSHALRDAGHSMFPGFIGNESLIQRARNALAWHFLRDPSYTHLLFIDADIRFRAQDVLKMLAADKPLLIGPVPLKGINWDTVKSAASRGESDLRAFTGHFNINPLPGHRMQDPDTPFEITHGGTAFMMIQRRVFVELLPRTEYYTNTTGSIPQGSQIRDFFRVEVDLNTHHLLSEDFYFCQSYRDIGGKVWCAPWVETGHRGAYMFEGQYAKSRLAR